MEVIGAVESRTQIKPGQTVELGRSQGFNSSDKTISRRQISLSIPQHSENQGTLLQFEVLGRNPIYVSKNGEVKIFKRFERGEMGSGDMFCCSAKDPIWYHLKEIESCRPTVLENDSVSNLESDTGFNGAEDLNGGDVDISDLDVVKEFGFVVMGHEFDSYPKKMIKPFKNWDWFLEEARKDGDDDDNEDTNVKRIRRRKRKKGDVNDDDEEWTGESEEDEKELINTRKNAQRPKYVTRSKDHGKAVKDTSKTRSVISDNRNRDLDDEDDEDEDEADETLGGFIVDDENLEEEVDEEEEEETDDDFEEDE